MVNVYDLIEKLQTFDPHLIVVLTDPAGNNIRLANDASIGYVEELQYSHMEAVDDGEGIQVVEIW